MIINELLAPRERIALPEPYRPWPGAIPSEGWDSVLYIAGSGRVCRLDFGAGARPVTSATRLCLVGATEFGDFEQIDLRADRVVLRFDDHLHVFDVSNGVTLLRVDIGDVLGAYCLTPDGERLICFRDDETQIWTLADERPSPHSTRVFNEGSDSLPGFGYEPQSATRVTRAADYDCFDVVVGHYGFAVTYSVSYLRAEPPHLTTDGVARVHEGFIFDPVATVIGSRYPFVAVNDGYGCGLKLVDVETGRLRTCPDVLGLSSTGLGYGRYYGAMPSGSDDKMIVKASGGWLLWDLTNDAVVPFCSPALELLRVDKNGAWAINDQDPSSLGHYPMSR